MEEDSGEGAPFALLDRYGDPYTGGVLQYVEEYGCVYAIDCAVEAASKCWFNEYDNPEIPGYSTFSKVNGDKSDCIVIRAAWCPDGDLSASKRVEFDSGGTMWSICERNADGFLGGVDGGTLRVTGGNRYEAASDWYAESVMYDDTSYRVFDSDEDVLIWNDEYAYYRMED